MKKRKVIYGVNGMIEYQSLVKIGRATMKVHFTNGSMNAIGVSPATFTTSNPLTQMAIENSRDFKRGLIKVIRTIPLEEEIHVQHNKKREITIPDLPHENSVIPDDEITIPDEEEDDGLGDFLNEGDNERPWPTDTFTSGVAPENEENIVPEGTDVADSKEFEVTCLADAREILCDRYGYTEGQVRTKIQILAAASEHGITFKGLP
jgi:hypothetical protein